MQPTVPSWVSWYRRLRPGERGAARARVPSRVAVYTGVFNPQNDRNLHLIRLDDILDHKLMLPMLPTPPNDWLKRLKLSKDMWHAQHVAPDLAREAAEQLFHNYPPVPVLGDRSSGRPLVRMRMSSAWGGWAAGALLLAVLVLIVRAAERCLERHIFKITARRRRSAEWSTPNVMATSVQHQNGDVGSIPQLDDAEYSSPSQGSCDLPPPYSECAPKPTSHNKNLNNTSSEEPPPPYSACFVAFSNKDIPTVHIHRRSVDEPHTSSHIDNVQNDLIETRQRVDVERANAGDGNSRVQLVFDNGRIVERTVNVAIDNVPEVVAGVGNTQRGNESNDANVPCVDDHAARETIILV